MSQLSSSSLQPMAIVCLLSACVHHWLVLTACRPTHTQFWLPESLNYILLCSLRADPTESNPSSNSWDMTAVRSHRISAVQHHLCLWVLPKHCHGSELRSSAEEEIAQAANDHNFMPNWSLIKIVIGSHWLRYFRSLFGSHQPGFSISNCYPIMSPLIANPAMQITFQDSQFPTWYREHSVTLTLHR